ncbi:hypothetical protein [Aquirhabdus parva]|uniref:Uncharacterized protein n=1 Tax=Aquirhabdus parva TaxID=2283318 RepID=A0A345P2B9_9GAMM|nr:hypothetical protein [Aquirhabdus parva]AXI01428.1 hypothetical protein HYN46_00035 [Aquirhabdus parva]AXI04374.1 hypothetical protein HYN46_16950 [Aquirhabdus parva]
MLPNGVLSTTPITGSFIAPDNQPFSYTTDYEKGGIHLQDPSQGLDVQVWTAQVKLDGIYISAPNTPEVKILSGLRYTEVGLSFDQNMNPHISFVQNGNAGLLWYDSAAHANATMMIPDAINPRTCLDDKRSLSSSSSDVLLFYLKSDNHLYYRQQRDRFGIEYPLGVVDGNVLRRVGMNQKYRLQIEIEKLSKPTI